jgi:antitoxin (DNA-binding transcriptional repressor) of toxin-antitoxin stability system
MPFRTNVPINAKRLRATLPDVVARVRKGTRFTVIYRSRPAFQIVPVDDASLAAGALTDDPLYRAEGVGASKDGLTSADHDQVLYPR